eukprot:102359-Hanusia_phi.AAC.1
MLMNNLLLIKNEIQPRKYLRLAVLPVDIGRDIGLVLRARPPSSVPPASASSLPPYLGPMPHDLLARH